MKISNYRYYKNEQLEISSIDSRLSNKEKRVRRYLMNYVINNNKPFSLEQLDSLSVDIDINITEVNDLVNSLLEKNAIVADEENNINFIYPVSALATNHIVKLSDGRKFYAMCAIDAIGSTYTFKQDVTVHSKCSNTGQDISIFLKNGELREYDPTDLHALHVDLNKNTNWSGDC